MSDKPTIRKSIPILGRRYSLHYHENIKTSDGENIFGDTDKNKKCIRIDLKHCKAESDLKDTVLHECIHAILAQSGIDNLLTDEVEEAIVVAIEHGLSALVEFKPAVWNRIKPVNKLELEMDD